MTSNTTTPHSEPESLLAYADGSLAADDQPAVARHLAECEDCANWVFTYSWIEQAEEQAGAAHPDAEVVALYAVDPAHVPAQERSGLAAHLDHCRTCRREVRLTVEALDSARKQEVPSVPLLLRFPRTHPAAVWAGALAASLALAVLWIPRPAPEAATMATTLADTQIEDRRVVHSDSRLVATNVQLTDSSELELRAAQGVVLGEGFSVERGGRLRIGNSVPAKRRKS